MTLVGVSLTNLDDGAVQLALPVDAARRRARSTRRSTTCASGSARRRSRAGCTSAATAGSRSRSCRTDGRAAAPRPGPPSRGRYPSAAAPRVADRAGSSYGSYRPNSYQRRESLALQPAAARSSSSVRSRSLRVSDAARSNSACASSHAAELREQVAAHGRQQVVALERGLGRQRVDDLEPGRRAERHRHRDRAVQLDDRRRRQLGQRVVQRGDPRPVGLLGGARSRVAGGDRGLERVRARARRPAPRRARARPGRARSGAGPSARGPGRAAARARRTGRSGRATATPGSPSAPPGRAPRAPPAPARPGCGRAAARPRTARGASSRRPRSPSSPR